MESICGLTCNTVVGGCLVKALDYRAKKFFFFQISSVPGPILAPLGNALYSIFLTPLGCKIGRVLPGLIWDKPALCSGVDKNIILFIGAMEIKDKHWIYKLSWP